MCADQLYLAREIKALEKAGIDGFHLDIMDGLFVPNLTLGFPMLQAIRPLTALPIAAHLMIREPERYIPRFAEAGADIISFHYESSRKSKSILGMLEEAKVKKAVAIKPKTAVEHIYPYLAKLDIVLVMSVEPGFAGGKFISNSIERIKKLDGERKRRKLKFKIEVDGNINTTTIPSLYAAGAEIFIGGSTGVFIKGKSFSKAVLALRQAACKGEN